MAPTSTTLHRRIYASPLGELTLTASEQGLRSLTWPEEAGGRAPADGPPIGDEPPDVAAVFDHVIAQLDEYFAGERTEFDVPLDPVGTEFQLRAWAALRRIPYGETRSYGEQARTIGSPAAVRAVGAAAGLVVEKLNLGALGNVTPQLHLHVVGRRTGDPAWPGPVWGHSPAVPYPPHRLGIVSDRLTKALKARGMVDAGA